MDCEEKWSSGLLRDQGGPSSKKARWLLRGKSQSIGHSSCFEAKGACPLTSPQQMTNRCCPAGAAIHHPQGSQSWFSEGEERIHFMSNSIYLKSTCIHLVLIQLACSINISQEWLLRKNHFKSLGEEIPNNEKRNVDRHQDAKCVPVWRSFMGDQCFCWLP